ncbi:MAG: sulfotransferase [Paracoccaceae bacterium]|nr:MAG: sulfotransferase [Paracoccaceae bacterium]
MRPLIFVLGVHRSGTSVLTAALQALGCTLGEFEDVRAEENPEGFFEHPGVRDLNDRMLAALGSSWDDWSLHAGEVARRLSELDPFRQDAATLLRFALEGDGPAAVKDPRICALWPFWRRAAADAGFRPRAVMILRHPDEVVASQVARATRNRHEHRLIGRPEPMRALWVVATTGLLADPPDDGIYLVRHADLVGQPQPVLQALTRDLALPTRPASLLAFARQGVKPGLHRQRRAPDAAPAASAWGDLARQVFDALADPGGNRWLAPADAAQVLDAVPQARAMLPWLAPMRDTIAHVRAAPAATPARAARPDDGPLRQAVQVLTAAIMRSGDAQLLSDLDRALAPRRLELAADPDMALVAARAAENAGRTGDALDLYARVIAAAKGKLGAHLRRIALLDRLGQPDEAAAARAAAAVIFPQHPAFRDAPPADSAPPEATPPQAAGPAPGAKV